MALPQRYTVSLAGVFYQFTLKWNPAGPCWLLDIADDAGEPVLLGVPLLTGADLLEQFEYLGIGGALVIQSDKSIDEVPTFTSLGTFSHIYFVTPPA